MEVRDFFETYYKYCKINHVEPTWEEGLPDGELFDFIKLNKKVNLLEIGCGRGKNLEPFKKTQVNLFGIDFSNSFTKKTPFVFSISDACFLPFRASVFDIVLDIGCLHCLHFNLWREYFKEIHRVMIPNGMFYLRVFSKNHPVVNGETKCFKGFKGHKIPKFYGANRTTLKEKTNSLFRIETIKELSFNSSITDFLKIILIRI